MRQIPFGPDRIPVSRLALGTWTFAGDSVWSASSETECIRVVHAALDAGVNLFDSAPNYGSGRSEGILGMALKGRPDALVSTKFKVDGKQPADLRRMVDESLLRLGRERIDLMQIHWPTENRAEMEQAFDTLQLLQQAGKIRFLGVCNFGTHDLEAYGHRPFISNQIPFSLMWRVAESAIAPRSKAMGLSTIAYSPLQQGLLSGKYASLSDFPANRKQTRHFASTWAAVRHQEAGMESQTQACLDAFLAESRAVKIEPTRLAIAYVLSKPFIDVVLAGARTQRQLEVLVDSVDTVLEQDVMDRLDAGSQELWEAAGNNADMYLGTRTH